MTTHEAHEAAASGAVIIDMRPPKAFALEHVAGAVNFQFNRADLADRADLALQRDVPVVIHAEPEPIAKAAVDILEGAGFEVRGFLEGGLKGWKAAGLPTQALPLLTVEDVHQHAADYRILDVRDGFEYRYGHIRDAELLEWTGAWAEIARVPADRPLAIVCGDQVRSTYVASLLQRAGKPAHLVFGGMADWLERGYPVEKGQKSSQHAP